MLDEKLTGINSIEGQKVILKITDLERKEDVLDIKINEGGYYLEKMGYYLIKS